RYLPGIGQLLLYLLRVNKLLDAFPAVNLECFIVRHGHKKAVWVHVADGYIGCIGAVALLRGYGHYGQTTVGCLPIKHVEAVGLLVRNQNISGVIACFVYGNPLVIIFEIGLSKEGEFLDATVRMSVVLANPCA